MLERVPCLNVGRRSEGIDLVKQRDRISLGIKLHHPEVCTVQ